MLLHQYSCVHQPFFTWFRIRSQVFQTHYKDLTHSRHRPLGQLAKHSRILFKVLWTILFAMHFFLHCQCWEYRQSQPTVFGPDIQFNKESQTRRSCWTHGESVQARRPPFGAKGHHQGPRPYLGPPYSTSMLTKKWVGCQHTQKNLKASKIPLPLLPGDINRNKHRVFVETKNFSGSSIRRKPLWCVRLLPNDFLGLFTWSSDDQKLNWRGRDPD